MFILHACNQGDKVKQLNRNITWSLPRSPTTTNMVRCCRATPFSIWTRIRLSIFFRTVAIVRLRPKLKLLYKTMLNVYTNSQWDINVAVAAYPSVKQIGGSKEANF